jgi:hypothetical protein
MTVDDAAQFTTDSDLVEKIEWAFENVEGSSPQSELEAQDSTRRVKILAVKAAVQSSVLLCAELTAQLWQRTVTLCSALAIPHEKMLSRRV